MARLALVDVAASPWVLHDQPCHWPPFCLWNHCPLTLDSAVAKATTDMNSVLCPLLGDSRFRDKVLGRTCTWLSPGLWLQGAQDGKSSPLPSQSEKHGSPPQGLGISSSRKVVWMVVIQLLHHSLLYGAGAGNLQTMCPLGQLGPW